MTEEPKFNIGDWVHDTINNNNLIQVTEQNIKNLNGTYKLWEPRGGDICIFWDDNTYFHYNISKLSSICKDKYFEDINKRRWDNIAPLEFVDTLRGK